MTAHGTRERKRPRQRHKRHRPRKANATINATIKGTRKKRESNGRRRVSDDRQQQRETQRCNTGPENRAKRTKRKPFAAISFRMTYLRLFFRRYNRWLSCGHHRADVVAVVGHGACCCCVFAGERCEDNILYVNWCVVIPAPDFEPLFYIRLILSHEDLYIPAPEYYLSPWPTTLGYGWSYPDLRQWIWYVQCELLIDVHKIAWRGAGTLRIYFQKNE